MLYNGLVNSIVLQLHFDITIDKIEIKYIINDRCLPMCIRNDVGVRVYLDQKKIDVDFFIKHPLYITLKNRDKSI